MKYTIFLIIAFLTFGCRDHQASRDQGLAGPNQQDKLNFTDNNGLKQGPWEIYKNDMLIAKGNYEDNKEEGIWVYWHENGNKKAEGNFKDGKKIGLWVEWYDDDVLMWKGTWKNGKRVIHYEGDKPIVRFLDQEIDDHQLIADTEYRVQIRIPGIPVDHQFIEVINGEINKTEYLDQYILKTGKKPEFTLVIGYFPDKNLPDYRNLIEKQIYTVHPSDPSL